VVLEGFGRGQLHDGVDDPLLCTLFFVVELQPLLAVLEQFAQFLFIVRIVGRSDLSDHPAHGLDDEICGFHFLDQLDHLGNDLGSKLLVALVVLVDKP
jgi:hypothetical protein